MSSFLGMIFGGVGSFDAAPSVHSEPTTHNSNTMVSIAVGLESPIEPGIGFDGGVFVRLFNFFGELLGDDIEQHYINQGNTKYEVDYKHYESRSGQQAAYGLFTAGLKPICIAWTAVTWPDGSNWMSTGDWAHDNMCDNAEWGISNLQAGSSEEGPYIPYCIWLDSESHLDKSAFQVYYPEFAVRRDGSLPKLEEICHTPSFDTYAGSPAGMDEWSYWTPPKWINTRVPSGSTLPPGRRDGIVIHDRDNATRSVKHGAMEQKSRPRKKRLSTDDNRIIISSKSQHRGSDLCNSHNSRGPSVISQFEGTFCDMRTKILYPLCGKGFEKELRCFNETTMSIVSADVTGRVVARKEMQLQFSEVMDWTT